VPLAAAARCATIRVRHPRLKRGAVGRPNAMPDLLFRYDWIAFIAFGTVAVVWARRELGLQPAAAVGPLVIANAPWLFSGVGAFAYPDRDSFARFDLRLGLLPYAMVGSLVVIWIVLLNWLFRGGAELLAASPKAVRGFNLPHSANGIKLMAVACVGGGIVGMIGLVIAASGTPR
jgi:hypothetical protein